MGDNGVEGAIPLTTAGVPVRFGLRRGGPGYQPDEIPLAQCRAAFYCPNPLHERSLVTRPLAVITSIDLITRVQCRAYPEHAFNASAPCYDDACPGWKIVYSTLRQAMDEHYRLARARRAQGGRAQKTWRCSIEKVGVPRRVADTPPP